MLLKVCLVVLLASAFAIRPRYHRRHHGGPPPKDMRELLSNLDEDAIMKKLKHMDGIIYHNDINDLYRNNKRYRHSHRDYDEDKEVLSRNNKRYHHSHRDYDEDKEGLSRNNKRYHHSHRDYDEDKEVLRKKKFHDVDIDKKEEKHFKILEIQDPASTPSEPATNATTTTTTQGVTTQPPLPQPTQPPLPQPTQPPLPQPTKPTAPKGNKILRILFKIIKNQGNKIRSLSYLMKEMRVYMRYKYVSKAELYGMIKQGGREEEGHNEY